MAANIRCIMRAKAPYGQGITKMKVNLTPEQSSTPSLMPETNTVYLTRPTEGTGELMELVGATVAWNQLIYNGHFASSTRWGGRYSTLSVSDNIATITPTSDGTARGLIGSDSSAPYVDAGHKYYLAVDVNSPINATVEMSFGGGFGVRRIVTANTWTRVEVVWSVNVANAYKRLLFALIANTLTTSQSVQYRNAIGVDLTQMFGSTIADYVYSLEQATAGSGIAWLKSYGYFTEDYYAYSAPTLQSVEATAHVTVGFNQWDEEWRNGNYSTSTGAFTASGTYFANKNLIPVFPNTAYCFRVGDNSTFRIFSYSADGSYTGRYWERTANTTFTTDADTHFINFCGLTTNYGATYKNDICINISKTTGTPKNGDYVPYVKRTYPTSPIPLRGILKMDENGNLYYDGDTYEWDGTVTRYYGTRAYQAGDESLTDAITDGTNTVYKLTTPTTESADPFTAVQTVEDGGTEEFTTSNGVPVGVKGRFANAVPMEGVDSFTVTANDGTTHTYPVTLSEEIYRGYVDMLTGEAVSDMASIAEYNGEAISEPWLSSLDEYAAGTTPTNGAQVVYPIAPEEVTATITGDPTELAGVVSATSTEGTVVWSELSEIGIKCIMKRKNPFQ